ncbi:prepilin-type N-terminal cleavage/methylation domain-containing protein [bacterium]|nr:prepilin-type N-terminal cleavage/methylation domain-containing protein [bacterium]
MKIRGYYTSFIKRRDLGFTLIEVMIAFGVLSLFSMGVFALYRSGQNASSQTFWLQKEMAELRNTTRHIAAAAQKSSYPSTICFPGEIIDNEDDQFKFHYSSRGTLTSALSASVSGKSSPGTHFLRFAESLPEKQGFQTDDRQAILTFHIYSLTKDSRVLYHKYRQTIPTTSTPNYIKGVSIPTVPSGTMVESLELAGDIESVTITAQQPADSGLPKISIEFNALYPRGQTRRTERVMAIPNVPGFPHPNGGDW